jgi:hypothetical protein
MYRRTELGMLQYCKKKVVEAGNRGSACCCK